MTRHPEIAFVELQGHTDERRPAAYNANLSSLRAAAVVDYLTQHGVSKDRLRSKGYGEREPLVKESSEAAWAKNQRVVFRIQKRAKAP